MKRTFLIIMTALVASIYTSPVSAQMTPEQFGKMMESYLATPAGREILGKSIQAYAQEQQKRGQEDQMKAQAAEIENQFKNPVKVEITANDPVKGPKDAKVTIVEFSDFQCPFCKRGMDVMDEVVKAYPKDVKVVFKQLPLPMHPEAKPAAYAALAAGKQGKFWEYHDALFTNQSSLSTEFYAKKAAELGLNVDKFKADMASEEIIKQVEADSAQAAKFGIQGTPGFFVNGVAVKGAYPLAHFKTIIDRHLGAAAKPEVKKM